MPKRNTKTCGVIIYICENNRTFILLGQTGVYLSDDKSIKKEIKDLEKELKSSLESNLIENEIEIENYYNYAKQLESKYGIPIKFIREGIFVTLNRLKSSFTIPKGGQEKKETNEQTALREVKEEIGIYLHPTKLIKMKKDGCFSYEIDEKEYDDIIKKAELYDDCNYGELFDIRFYDLESLDLDRINFNAFTKESIELFKNNHPKPSPKNNKPLNPNAKPFEFKKL